MQGVLPEAHEGSAKESGEIVAIYIGKTGRVRLTGKDLEKLRRECYERDDHRCTVCGIYLRWEAGYFDSMHMAHIVSRGAGGSDALENVTSKCPGHHWEEHSGGKVIMRKK
jgi:5-methylcytosine-specific restriction endonuclease McrA